MERNSSRGRDDNESRGRGGDRDARGDRDRGGRDRGRDDDRDTRGGRDRDDRDSRGGRDESRGGGRGRDRESSGSGSSRGYSYSARSRADVEERQNQSANDFDRIVKDGIKQYTVKDGLNNVRFLPPTWANPKHYGYDLFVHYGVGPDRQSYLDLDKMKDQPDPITEERAELRRSGDATEQELKEMDSKKRVGVYLVDRDNESEGVQFWAMPFTLDKDISLRCVDRSTGEVMPIDHPEDGYDISFIREGKKLNTKYVGVEVARRPSSLGKSAWLDFAVDNPIPDVLKFYSYDEIAKAFGGGGAQRERSRDDRDDRDDARSDRGGRDQDRDDRDRGRERDSADRGRGDRDDDRGRSGERDRGDSDRGSRGRDPVDGRGRDDDRGDDGARRGRSSTRDEPPELTWDEVHAMTGDELDALVSERDLNINVNDAKTDAELADWICEDLKIEKQAATRRGRTETPPDDAEDRLARMRRERR